MCLRCCGISAQSRCNNFVAMFMEEFCVEYHGTNVILTGSPDNPLFQPRDVLLQSGPLLAPGKLPAPVRVQISANP